MNSASSPPKCPSCQRVLLSRTSKLCSWCSAVIPEHVLVQADAAAVLSQTRVLVQPAPSVAEEEDKSAPPPLAEVGACSAAGKTGLGVNLRPSEISTARNEPETPAARWLEPFFHVVLIIPLPWLGGILGIIMGA